MYVIHVHVSCKKKKKKLSALLIKINFVWVYNSIFLLYIQIVRVVLTTQRQHQKWKTKSLKVQTQIKNLQAKVMEWVLRVKITVAHSVKSICQKLNSLFVKEQGSGEGLLRQLFWHYPKNTISQNLQGHILKFLETFLPKPNAASCNYTFEEMLIKAMDIHYSRYELCSTTY